MRQALAARLASRFPLPPRENSSSRTWPLWGAYAISLSWISGSCRYTYAHPRLGEWGRESSSGNPPPRHPRESGQSKMAQCRGCFMFNIHFPYWPSRLCCLESILQCEKSQSRAVRTRQTSFPNLVYGTPSAGFGLSLKPTECKMGLCQNTGAPKSCVSFWFLFQTAPTTHPYSKESNRG